MTTIAIDVVVPLGWDHCWLITSRGVLWLLWLRAL